jgi:GT2 family glycosyltransferase/glycosyltransferase involved in cell wall biosynthesis
MTKAEVVEPETRKDTDTSDDADSIEPGPPDEAAAEATPGDAPGATSVPRRLPIGGIDTPDSHQISGWAWYETKPDEPVDVEILIDDVAVLKVCADQFRADLLAAGAGNGRHGFLVQNLQTHVPPGRHSVRALRASDGLELPGSPSWVTRPQPASEEGEAGTGTQVADSPRAEGLVLVETGQSGTEPGAASLWALVEGPPAAAVEGTAIVARPRDDAAEEGEAGAGTHVADSPQAEGLVLVEIGQSGTEPAPASLWTSVEGPPAAAAEGAAVVTEPRDDAAEESEAGTRTHVADSPQAEDLALVELGQSGTEPGAASPLETATAPVEKPSIPVPAAAAEGAITSNQRAPALRVTPPIGSLDRVGYDGISGWVWDPTHPDESVDIEILDNDVVVLKVCADQFRSDLLAAGAGNGRHGFSLRNLAGVFPLSRHRVRVRRATDGLDLPGSPTWIIQPGLDNQAIDFMEQGVFSAIQVATRPDDLAQPLSQILRLLNDLVNAHEALARTQRGARYSPSAAETAAGLGLADQMRELVERLHFNHMPLYFEPSDEPIVSVIIPVHNKFSYTYDCLRSIQQALPKHPFEIIIVDDCSDDETLLSALVFAGGVHIVRNASNLGFVRTCNAGAAAAKGKYLLFLNNDTLVKEGWLDELVETFEQVPNIGIAGSKLLFEDGSLQEAGGIIWRLGDGWNWGRGRDPTEPAFCFLRDADWVSGAALMIERTLFEDLNGFDELYAPAYYEDTDLAFRVRERGKRVVMQPASQIVHLEGISAGTDTSGPGMKRFQVINHAKFYRRWKDTLITHRFNGQQPELEAERLVRRRAYFIDDTVPSPDQDAGSNAAVEHMRALMELGYKVTFLPADNMAKIDPYTGQLQKLGIECQYHPFYWSVEEVFRKAANKPDLVYLYRYTNASKYATMVRRYFPDCRIVYSVCDLHFLRMERQAEIDASTMSVAQVAAQRRSEMSAMQSVDCVIVHSPVEAKLLHEADPSLNVKVVSWTVRPRPTTRPFTERSGAAFVGGFSHQPNADAVRYLVSDILPLLRRRVPDCTTYIIGSKIPDEIMNLQAPGLVPLGFVPVLADILHKLRCTVVPLRYGAGIKGKVLESFAHGLPCVMSEVAAEGLELPEDLAWLIARTPEEFAEKVALVHGDAAYNRALSETGLAYIEQRYSASAIKQALQAAVYGEEGTRGLTA